MNAQQRAAAAQELSGALGPGKVVTDPTVVSGYANGSFRNVPGLTDQWRYLTDVSQTGPEIVVKPVSTQDVAATVTVANRLKVPVVPWGGASNFVGGDAAPFGGIVVDMRGMNRVVNVDREKLTATVQPGVSLMDFEVALRNDGLRHGTLAGSAIWATVGGAIASDAHTLTGFRYGTLTENILSLEVVTPTGLVVRTGPPHDAGYDLSRLFTRSEGTLGIITEATVRVHRVQPFRTSFGFAFTSFEEAVRAHHTLWNAGLPELSTIMTFDKFTSKFPQFSKEMGGTEAEAGTLITLEGRQASTMEAETIVKQMVNPRKGHAIPSRTGAAVDEWWTLLTESAGRTINGGEGLDQADWKVGPHVWVPQEKVVPVRAAFEEVVSRHGMKYTGVVYTPTRLLLQFLYAHDDREGCGRAYREILKEVAPMVRAAGGTITGAHGSGLVFKDEVALVHGSGLEVMRSIKRALDPNGIMNPGKVFD